MNKTIITLTIIVIIVTLLSYKINNEPFYNVSNNDAYPHMLSNDHQKYNITAQQIIEQIVSSTDINRNILYLSSKRCIS